MCVHSHVSVRTQCVWVYTCWTSCVCGVCVFVFVVCVCVCVCVCLCCVCVCVCVWSVRSLSRVCVDEDGVGVIVDQEALEFVKGSTVDFCQELIRSAFLVQKNPQ